MIFTIPVTTRVEDFDQNGLLTPPALLSIFENTAVRHANTVGYSPMADSLQNGMSWVITNWRAAVLRAPAYDESFQASTWLCVNPRLATREMLLRTREGEVLARGQAKLALVQRSTGKPCLPTPERLAAYHPGCVPLPATPTGSPSSCAAATWTTTAICTTPPISPWLWTPPPSRCAAAGCTVSASPTAALCSWGTS